MPKLSPNVTNIQLASLFGVHVANVLVRPPNALTQHLVESDRKPYEAWIVNIGDEQTIKKLTKDTNGKMIGDTIIRCNTIVRKVDTAELCENYQNGKCEYSISCNMIHFQCVKPDTCDNDECWYGHTTNRPYASKQRPKSGKFHNNNVTSKVTEIISSNLHYE